MANRESKLTAELRECMKAVRELYNHAEMDDKLILSSVLDRLIEIQSIYQEVLDEKKQVEEKAKEYQQWNEDKSKYELFRLQSGGVVVIPKESNKSPYQTIWYCKNCFDNFKLSNLQATPNDMFAYHCPHCKTIVGIGYEEAEKVRST